MMSLAALIVLTFCSPVLCEPFCSIGVEEDNAVENCGKTNLAEGADTIELIPLEDEWIDKDKLIFIESSGGTVDMPISVKHVLA
jgi:hypothetical protein